MYNIDDLNLSGNEVYSYEESELFCKVVGDSSHLYEPRDASVREAILKAINETFDTSGHTMPLWINAKRGDDSKYVIRNLISRLFQVKLTIFDIKF